MTISSISRYNIAIAIILALVIHLIVIAYIALQTGRAFPVIEGEEAITLTFGGAMSTSGGMSEHPQKGQQATSDTSQSDSAQKVLHTSSSNPPTPSQRSQSELVVRNVPQSKNGTIQLSERKQVLDKTKTATEKNHSTDQNIKPVKTPENTLSKLNKTDSNKPTPTLAVDTPSQTNNVNPSSATSSHVGSETTNSDNGVGKNTLSLAGNDQFAANGDGTYTALGSHGIRFKILKDADPKYPKEARSIGYSKVIKVRVRLLVGLNGSVESVEILNDKIPDLGFKEQAITAIKSMAFEPIVYQGQNIKMYFKKTIVFQS